MCNSKIEETPVLSFHGRNSSAKAPEVFRFVEVSFSLDSVSGLQVQLHSRYYSIIPAETEKSSKMSFMINGRGLQYRQRHGN